MIEKIKGTFDRGVAAVSVKSETLVESSRTKMTIANTQNSIDAEISALGRKFYDAWKEGYFSQDSFIADLERIRSMEDEIVALKEHLEEIKREENRVLGTQQKNLGVIYCRNCGRQLAADSRFCDECGTQVG